MINVHIYCLIDKYTTVTVLSFLQEPEEFNYYNNFLTKPEVRNAIHVGNLTYNDGTAVEKHLMLDVMDTVKPWVATLMDNYKVSRGVTIYRYIDKSQYTKNLYCIDIRNLSRNISRFFFLLIKLFIFHSILVLL